MRKRQNIEESSQQSSTAFDHLEFLSTQQSMARVASAEDHQI